MLSLGHALTVTWLEPPTLALQTPTIEKVCCRVGNPIDSYKLFVYLRQLNWGLWPFYAAASALIGLPLWLKVLFIGQTLLWSFVGARILGVSLPRTVAYVARRPWPRGSTPSAQRWRWSSRTSGSP